MSSGLPVEEERRRLFEYFIVAGLNDAQEAEELVPLTHECGNKIANQVAPITDICVIFPSLGETIPKGYECIETTPSGHPADLNHGSFRSNSVFLCYKRGYHKPPLVDIGILDESKGEKVKADSIIIDKTPFGNPANVNNSSSALYFTTRRSSSKAPPHQLVITHICVILTTKGEAPPHTYYKIDRNLNKSLVGSGVYVCYKKSQSCSKRISYKPSVLDCYPKIENIHESIARNVPMFCLPTGAVLESWSDRCGQPDQIFSTCVLTDEMGTKYYGASLTFYEKYSNKLTDAQLEKLELGSVIPDEVDEDGKSQDSYDSTKTDYYSNKAICIVSKYPFFEPFRRFIYFLHHVSSTPGQHHLPIERYISHLMLEVPFPTPSRPRVLVQMGEEMNTFESHDDSQVPLSGATFVESLKYMGVDNLIYAMLLALLEQKILIHSLRPWLLTTIAETLCALIFPFNWQCPYIPQCPLDLAGVLHAPLPFICGVHSRYFDLYEDPPSDVTCFDMDTSTVSQSAVQKSLKPTILPKKPLKKLRAALQQISDEMLKATRTEANSADYKKMKELRIREEFLRFICSIMSGYAEYLTPISRPVEKKNSTDVGVLFDVEGFIKSRDRNSQEFFLRFTATQSFIRFIEERSFISDKNIYDVFFDDCVRKVENAVVTGNVATVSLLDKEAFIANRTIVVPTPELYSASKHENGFSYTTFPTRFRHDLFETELILQNRRQLPSPNNDYPPPKKSEDGENVHPSYILTRSKHEIRMSLAEVQIFIKDFPTCWARTLLFYAYSLWFLQLPSMIQMTQNKMKMLRLTFRVCHRILIHQCGELGFPKMAGEVLELMRRSMLPVNAITYGIYHRAVMSGHWPSKTTERAITCWTKLRNVLDATIRLRRIERARRANILRYKAVITPPPVPTPPPKSESKQNISASLSLTGSPSLSSLVHQIRKQTLKKANVIKSTFLGVDGVAQQTSTFLKKSGLNNIIADAKNSFRSNTSQISRDHSTTFSSMSLSEENLLMDTKLDTDSTTGMECFQQDMGSADHLLGGESFWMRDIWPGSTAENGRNDQVGLDVNISSYCNCPSCNAPINDDQLMNGWAPNDANLNSTCAQCSASFSPLLRISVYQRQSSRPTMLSNRPQFYLSRFAASIGDDGSNQSNTSKVSAPTESLINDDPTNLLAEISVPFLSPLVLRKELETLSRDNIHFLTDASVRLSHPIIFWNLIYYFRRLDLPSHLYTFLPNTSNTEQWPSTTFNKQNQSVETTNRTNGALMHCEFVKLQF